MVTFNTPPVSPKRRDTRIFGRSPATPLYRNERASTSTTDATVIYSDSEEEEREVNNEIEFLKNEIRRVEEETTRRIRQLEQDNEARVIQIRRVLKKKYDRKNKILNRRSIKREHAKIRKSLKARLPSYNEAIVNAERIQNEILQDLGILPKCRVCHAELGENGECENILCIKYTCPGCNNKMCTCDDEKDKKDDELDDLSDDSDFEKAVKEFKNSDYFKKSRLLNVM